MKAAYYIFVVDTDSYSGNFERQMAAYMTGTLGQCTVGGKEKAQYEEAAHPDLESKVQQMPDDRNCYRPVSIMPTPGWFNNGMGKHYREGSDSEELALKESIVDMVLYKLPYLKMKLKVVEDKSFTEDRCTEEDAWLAINQDLDALDKATKNKKLTKYPAYQSVGIFFNEPLTTSEQTFLKARANEFAVKNNLTIFDFRIIECTKKEALKYSKR